MYIDILVIAFTNFLYLRCLRLFLCEDKEDLVRKFGTFGALEKGFWCGLQDDFMSFLSSLLCLPGSGADFRKILFCIFLSYSSICVLIYPNI